MELIWENDVGAIATKEISVPGLYEKYSGVIIALEGPMYLIPLEAGTDVMVCPVYSLLTDGSVIYYFVRKVEIFRNNIIIKKCSVTPSGSDFDIGLNYMCMVKMIYGILK